MKLWHFDIEVNGQDKTVHIEAEKFENAFAQLRMTPGFDNVWSLVKFEEKLPEPDPTAEELKKKSEELWQQVNWEELEQAREILKKNFNAMEFAVDFDAEHPSVVDINPTAHSNDVCRLKHAANCLDELRVWLECF